MDALIGVLHIVTWQQSIAFNARAQLSLIELGVAWPVGGSLDAYRRLHLS